MRLGMFSINFSRRESETITLEPGDGARDNVTQLFLDALADELGGDEIAAINRVAIVEFAVGLFSRAFMVAEVDPPIPGLNPETLSMAAREVMLRGNAVHEIEVLRPRGEIALVPASMYEVRGGVLPADWRYDLTLDAPSGQLERMNVPAAGVVHLRAGQRYSSRWHGVSPLVSAGMTAAQLATIERSLHHESRTRVAHILPTPDGSDKEQFEQLIKDIRKANGRTVLSETMAAGGGQGALAAPKRDYETIRLGPQIPQTSIDLRDRSGLLILGALGIPPQLYMGDGGALREAYRQFLTSEVVPMGKLFAHELEGKLERPIRFNFRELAAADIAARARAYGTLTGAAMDPARAELLSGLST